MFLKSLPWLFYRHRCLKNVFLSQYLFIFLSQYCVKMSRVYKALRLSCLLFTILKFWVWILYTVWAIFGHLVFLKALFTRDILTHNIAKKIFLSHGFLLAKVSSWQINKPGCINKTYQGMFLKSLPWLFYRNQCLKNVFLSHYLFIAILCVKMSRVNKA